MPRHAGPVTTVTMRLVTDAAADRALKVLVYSDDVHTREQVILALGRRPHPDLPELEYVEVATEPVVIQNMDAGGIDLVILDGEAVPAGGMGIAKQLKDEIYECPPVVVQTGWAMGEIVSGSATPAQVAGFAVGLRAKGETVEELTGLLEAMYAVAPPISVEGRLLDVVGTGGDRSMSVNISTMSAIVAAGAGARVVKHGNRSASSQSGSADVLEALGIRLDLAPA